MFSHLAQEIAHVHGHVAKVDINRTRVVALVADSAVVRHVLELFPVGNGNAATGLLLVQKRLDQQGSRQNLIARRVGQIGLGYMRRTHGLALSAAETVLDRIRNGANVALLHDQRFITHQAERGCVGPRQIRFRHQLALIESSLRIDLSFVGMKRGQFFLR